jgi:hypothetical protein
MDDVRRLLACEEIRQLAYRYALATDSRDLDMLVGLFIDDVQVGRDRFGREALREDFEQRLRAVGITILHVTNHIVDFDDDDHARGVVYCRGEIQDGHRWIVQAIQYRDLYERRASRWYFVRRKHLLWYGAEVGQNPLGLPPTNWPVGHTGRGTLPESLESWREFWSRRDG